MDGIQKTSSRFLQRSILAIASTLFAGLAWGGDVELVEGEISGIILRNGKPVPGLLIASCADFQVVPRASACEHPIRVTTDHMGRFAYKSLTGVRPPPPGSSCRGGCIGDPGWGYWFRLQDQHITRHYWNGGLGYGRVKVRIECELSKQRNEELECLTYETALRYERGPELREGAR
ncbi:MAG: hypothetical protein V4864_13170 [Pseudomonadota bacterium]